ncbi:sensor histidine kinase [Clostridium beijerinckii]|uniref:sensor histidine kinase n=1 Tax=Clostridium beijerinckii TaxID=1520 RepID=UPI0014940F0F|nr:PAS domain-containing sensor histidine kinase [Clostridium beijerinckii]NOW04551.1 PAS domain S-box-containing protein [Clostridium beijerinckii]NYC02307.1 PAS domain S-box-containing protein [Clostridium beijerinckii]
MKKNNENDNSMSSLIKTTIVFFVSIMIYQNLSQNSLGKSEIYDYHSLYIVILFVVSALLFNRFVLFISLKIVESVKNPNIAYLIEVTFLALFIFLPMYLLRSYEIEFKFIFLLIIILTVIKMGLKYGVISSVIVDIIILTSDIFYETKIDGINIQFERDLMVCIIFIFVAWILGQYVTIESNNKLKTEKKLQQLNSKLKEQLNQRKEMESLLLNNKICYDMLFENSVNSIIVHRNGEVIYANASATRLLGLKGENLYNHYLLELSSNIEERYSNISNNKLVKITSEENILNCDGELIPVLNTSSFFTYKGEPSVLTFLRDITSEKKVESLQEDIEKKLKLLNESREFNNLIMNFFTNMSHELKTPVNVIYSAVQTIRIYLDDYNLGNSKKCKSYLKTMKQNCLRMIRIINNFLDTTKLNSDSGFIKLKKRNGNIVNIIEDITQSIASYVNDKDITLIFDTNVEEKIMGFDYDMMERIMLNLISNALKYSHSNGHIYVDFIDKGTSVIIKVKDEGDGIPEDKLNFIFERFGQVDNTLSRKCEGTGIGLYLVKSFVEMHGGKISVASVEGQGSEFIIELPTELVENEEEEDKLLFKTNVEKIEIEFSDIYSLQY